MIFDELGLSAPLLRAIEAKGYREPSPIQAAAIPAVLTGRDLMAAAQTGTGKTAGFTLPILQLLHDSGSTHPHRIRVLVLTPTRELAAQVADSVATYGAHLPFKSAVVFGGVKINPQISTLRKGVDILVATPGRLLDLLATMMISDAQIVRISDALSAELRRRGFEVVPTNAQADMFLSWKLMPDESTTVSTFDPATQPIVQGSLYVTMIDPLTLQSIWRASFRTDLRDQPETEAAAQYRAAAAQAILAQFPPLR